MNTQTPDISTAQKASWNKFSPGWKKWDQLIMRSLLPASTAIIDHLEPHGTQRVLDIAAGTGEPGMTIAKLLSGGTVVITDLSDGMLQVATEKVALAGITNVEFKEADANAIPFADNSFDLVSCRMGYMFFPDMQKAANEMARVLKPGGRVATAVWAEPEKNFWITCMMQNINKHIPTPPPELGAPGMFRCARPGIISDLFSNAGLQNISEHVLPCPSSVNGPEQYWEMLTEIAAPFVAALSSADDVTVAMVKTDVITEMTERFPNGNIDGCARVIVGTK